MKLNCVTKGFSILLGKPQEEIAEQLTYPYFENEWGLLLESYGFKTVFIPPKPYQKRMTVHELAELAKPTDLILARCAHHVIAIKDKIIYDPESSYNLCVYHYYIKHQDQA